MKSRQKGAWQIEKEKGNDRPREEHLSDLDKLCKPAYT